MKAVVVGATGGVGHQVVEALCRSDAWEQIVVVLRKDSEGRFIQNKDFDNIVGSKKIKQSVVGTFDEIAGVQAQVQGFDAMFCTIAAYMKEDGLEAVKKVDFDYTVACADLAEKSKISSFSLLTMNGDATIPEEAKGWKGMQRIKGQAVQAVLEKLRTADRPDGIKFIYIYKPGVIFGRMSAKGKATIRTKGNWDSMVGTFAVCCCCLVNSVGVHARRLGSVMVSVAETRGGFVNEEGGSATLDNPMIVKYSKEAS